MKTLYAISEGVTGVAGAVRLQALRLAYGEASQAPKSRLEGIFILT